MRRLKKKIYLGVWGSALVVFGIVRACNPSLMGEDAQEESLAEATQAETQVVQPATQVMEDSVVPHNPLAGIVDRRYHPVGHVSSYDKCFPDVQDVQIVYARKWGVRPVRDRQQAEQRKDELVFVGSNPFYAMDAGMSHSIPYLVPRAASLLQQIGRNFLDSLAVRGVPLHRIIVTSVLRSEQDLHRLQQVNPNVSPESCHRFGTTFDIAYNRYQTVAPPGETRRAVQNDTLKWVLSQVLRDLRVEKRCCVKHEVKQACFHVTTR